MLLSTAFSFNHDSQDTCWCEASLKTDSLRGYKAAVVGIGRSYLRNV